MRFTQTDNRYILKIERGEVVVETITKFCQKQSIRNAIFSGIGAVDKLTCGYYSLEEKQYYFTDYNEMIEVVSLTGNVTLKEDNPFVHVHGVFTNTKNQAFGGHIVEMQVGVVLEVILESLKTNIQRVADDCIGLALMDLPERL